MIPSTDEALDDEDFLAFADEELQTTIVQLLLSVREEFLVAKEPHDVSITASTSDYALPTRAIGGKLRQVLISTNGDDFAPLGRVDPENDWTVGSGTHAVGYRFNGNYVTLVPTPASTSGTLRLSYFMRPSRLVGTSAVGLISAINTSTGVVTCNIPSTFTTSERFDLVKGKSGFECLAIDLTASAVGGASITFSAADLPSGLAVGDYVCLAGESPIPQVPVELHPLLSQRVVCRVLEALGDPKLAVAEATSARLMNTARSLLSPRDQGARRVIVNPYGPGMGSRYGRRGV